MPNTSRWSTYVGSAYYPPQPYVHASPASIGVPTAMYAYPNSGLNANISVNSIGIRSTNVPSSNPNLSTKSPISSRISQSPALPGKERINNVPISQAQHTPPGLQKPMDNLEHARTMCQQSTVPGERDFLQKNLSQTPMENPQTRYDKTLNDPRVTPLSNPIFAQSVLNRLIGHEPCIHTLNYLEAQLETKKQIEKSQDEQLKTLREQSVTLEKEIKCLTLASKEKNSTIDMLRSQIGKSNIGTKISAVPRQDSVIKEQQGPNLRLKRRIIKAQTKFPKNHKKISGSRKSNRGTRLKKIPDVISFRDRVSKQKSEEDELARLRKENETFKLEISRLERENAEVVRLRLEVLDLRRRYGARLEETPDNESTTTG